jgi:hypothetical protein
VGKEAIFAQGVETNELNEMVFSPFNLRSLTLAVRTSQTRFPSADSELRLTGCAALRLVFNTC